jgi:hypothetical protein
VGGGAGGEAPLDTYDVDTFDLSSPDSAATFAPSDWSGIAAAVTPPSFQLNEASFATIPPNFGVFQHQEAPEFTHLSVRMDASNPQAASTDSLSSTYSTSPPVYPIDPGRWLLSYSPPINSSSLAPSPASSQQMTHAVTPQRSPPGTSPSSSHTKIKSSFVSSIFPLKLDIT